VFIERIQVEGGFLDGLDLSLTAGLNVLIGGRGTGKTSMIELIRFCLGVKAQTTDADQRAREHALFVLGDGRVTITLLDVIGDKVFVSRVASQNLSEASGEYDDPALFSQKEIESLGLSATARLALLDSFLPKTADISKARDRLARLLASTTSEAAALRKEIESFDQHLRALPQLEAELATLVPQEAALSLKSKEVAERQKILLATTEDVRQMSAEFALLQDASAELVAWAEQLDEVARRKPDLQSVSDQTPGSVDSLAPARKVATLAAESVGKAVASLTKAASDLDTRASAVQKQRILVEDKLRQLRKEIETHQKGAGDLAKRAAALREKVAGLRETKKVKEVRSKKLGVVEADRSKVLDEFENLHSSLFAQRAKAAVSLTKAVGPLIRIEARQAAEFSEYVATITSLLRGSGIKYNDLAIVLAQAVSPRELVESVERQDADFLVGATQLSRDRVLRILAALRDARLASILTVRVEDDVSLQLLDGKDYKDAEHLSVGQRCTVVLPIVLEHTEKLLILDQPEDHLDNAFIVGTLIKALKHKATERQILVSTHNANIPVLGDASNVVVLGSDGQRGYVTSCGHLEEPAIVGAITSLMEGGKEAFDRRAQFYKEHFKK